MKRGKFITLEGGEGVGKSTQAKRLAERLERAGVPVIVTREPGGTPVGEDVRDLIMKDRPTDPVTELLLFAAARAEHVTSVVRPALDEGTWVISDRFIDSTRVCQGKRYSLEPELIALLERYTVAPDFPDLTLILDLPASEGVERAQSRGTLSLVTEVADLIAKEHPETILCAAGGIGDGRGVAAAFMLGAEGVMVGSRLWASKEANVSERMHDAALHSTGDDTIRSQTMDLARKLDWPQQYSARVLKNEFIRRWHGREAELVAVADEEAAKYRAAWAEGDPEKSNTFVGEVVGLIRTIEPVSDIIDRMMHEAEALLQSKPKDVISKP